MFVFHPGTGTYIALSECVFVDINFRGAGTAEVKFENSEMFGSWQVRAASWEEESSFYEAVAEDKISPL